MINAAPDGFNINVDCGSTHMERLQRHVVEQGLDVGFAYDGDADRCLAVDERGRVVDGDQILYVCGVYLNTHAALENMGVQNAIAEAEASLAGEGRVLVRKSGTESVIRVLAEAPDQASADAAMKRIANALEAL